jgi:hypothetical protein
MNALGLIIENTHAGECAARHCKRLCVNACHACPAACLPAWLPAAFEPYLKKTLECIDDMSVYPHSSIRTHAMYCYRGTPPPPRRLQRPPPAPARRV